MTAENFSKIFIEKKIQSVIKEYEEFRKFAVLDKKMYCDFLQKLHLHKYLIVSDMWKLYFYELFYPLVVICENGGTEKRERRQDFIDEILSCIIGIKDKISPDVISLLDVNAKYLVLDMMLDIICAYSDDVHKIQFSAMIYDMICGMNQEEDSSFQNFYGEDAEVEIIQHTLSIITIISQEQKLTPEKWIQNSLHSKEIQNMGFVKNFVDKLLEKQKIEVEKSKKRKKQRIFKVIELFGIFLLLLCVGLGGGMVIGRVTSPEKILLAQKEAELKAFQEEMRELDGVQGELQQKITELEAELQKMLQEKETQTEPSEMVSEPLTPEVDLNTQQTHTMEEQRYIRAEKSTEAEILGNANAGDIVTVLTEVDENGWLEIQYGDIVGYVKIQ